MTFDTEILQKYQFFHLLLKMTQNNQNLVGTINWVSQNISLLQDEWICRDKDVEFPFKSRQKVAGFSSIYYDFRIISIIFVTVYQSNAYIQSNMY